MAPLRRALAGVFVLVFTLLATVVCIWLTGRTAELLSTSETRFRPADASRLGGLLGLLWGLILMPPIASRAALGEWTGAWRGYLILAAAVAAALGTGLAPFATDHGWIGAGLGGAGLAGVLAFERRDRSSIVPAFSW